MWIGRSVLPLPTSLPRWLPTTPAPAAPGDASARLFQSLRRPLLIFLLTAVLIGLTGWLAYRHLAAQVREGAAASLAKIGDYKADQLQLWLDDRRRALATAARSPLLVEVATGGGQTHHVMGRRFEYSVLESIRVGDGYSGIALFDTQWRPLTAVGGTISMTPSLVRQAQGALMTHQVLMSDIYTPEPDGEPVLDFVVPVLGQSPGNQGAVALLVARVTEREFIDPVIQQWPVESASGEALLVHRDNGAGRFITPPRFLSNDLPRAVTAGGKDEVLRRLLAGVPGPVEGRDYRGTPVLAVMHPIDGTNWLLYAKTDLHELYAPLQRLFAWVLGVAGTALLAAAGLVTLWWRAERLKLSMRLAEAERRNQLVTQHFAMTSRFINDAVFLLDDEGRILDVNDRAETIYGYSREEFLQKRVFDLRPRDSEFNQRARRIFDEAMRGAPLSPWISQHWRRDGSSFPVEINSRVFIVGERRYMQGIVRDITERLAAEQRITEMTAERERLLTNLRQQFDHMPVGCAVFMPHVGLTQINPAFERIFGYSFEELADAGTFTLINPPERSESDSQADRVDGNVMVNLTKSGRRIHCRWSLTPLRAPDATLTGLMAMCEDISDQVFAEQALRGSEERYRLLAETSPVGVFRTDASGRTTYVNQRCVQISGLSLSASQISGWDGCMHPDDRRLLADPWREHMKEGRNTPFRAEFRVLRPDRSISWVLAQASPEFNADRKLQGYVGTITDITDLKAAQHALQESRDHFEERVDERTRELELAKVEAERADRAKTAFLSTVSHELRTPLNAILGFTDVILNEFSGPLTEAQHQQLTLVQDSAVHLRALIEDVLDISRIEAGRMSLDLVPVDIADLLRRRVASFAPEASRKSVRLESDIAAGLGTIQADVKRVGQIINNLLTNALKFTDAGSVRLSAHSDGDSVRIEVVDTGIGISGDQLENIFRPFNHLQHPAGRIYEGTGLGLTISRQLARTLGGDLTVTSTLGAGSCFTLTLPVAGAQEDVGVATGIFREPLPAA